jgi:hypothetical protein
MSWKAANPHDFIGRVVATGHCVRLVQEACGAPHTSRWRPGRRVRGGDVEHGTAIATFGGGRYQNKTDGSSHAAIFIAEEAHGLSVIDQWRGHPTAHRVIRFKGGEGTANNDGDRFFTIEEA